jgi:hypothetical protein
MPPSKLIPLTPAGRKYLRYILSFGVTLGAGLAPIWGGEVIPGFHAILDVFPRDLLDVIPFVSLPISALALVVQFFFGESMQPRRLKTAFIVTFMMLIVLVLITYIVYKAVVIRIEVPAAHKKVAYLVGSKPLPTCECAKRGLEIRGCIGIAISANPDEVAACFSREEISRRSTLLSVLYMLVMFSFGMLVGLLILKEAPEVPPTRPAKAAGFRA